MLYVKLARSELEETHASMGKIKVGKPIAVSNVSPPGSAADVAVLCFLERCSLRPYSADCVTSVSAVSYTHLTLPTKRIV